ncbi:MAG: alpha/beta fold hydrolase [Ignavibacteriae bacterium]|nr:alpha/beta fold hydrolase [Ignavibacteriota bacterium]
MKKLTLAVLLFLTSISIQAQDITGQWNGVLNVQGTQLRLIINISKTVDGYTSTLDSPDQGAKDIPATSTTFENNTLKFTVTKLQLEYTGVLDADGKEITGTLTQGGGSLPLDLSRESVEKETVTKSQDPVKPYPYYSEDVKFMNDKAGIELAGTLTIPNKNGTFPVVVLISGSGPQNRNEEIMNHRPFLVLSDHLTRNGIGVFRYDDRGVADSKGDFKSATSLDFALDAEAAVEYLKSRKEIDKNKIGLAGHSEGGYIAPMIAARNDDISFIVMLAGPGIPGKDIVLLQTELIEKASGVSNEEVAITINMYKGVFDIIKKNDSDDKIKSEVTAFVEQQYAEHPEIMNSTGKVDDKMIAQMISVYSSPWFKFFLEYDPATDLEKVTVPVLAIIGEKDLQVPPKVNLEAIKKALDKAGNKNLTAKELPGLNHLFQNCTTGLPEEYGKIDETFSPQAMDIITEWILDQVR